MAASQTSPDDGDHAVVHTPGWTIEPHGNGYALYSGRGPMAHGMNLVYLSEPDSNWGSTKRLIESAPRLLAACREMIEAMNDYECSVDDPPTPKHREMMLRAMKAVEDASKVV